MSILNLKISQVIFQHVRMHWMAYITKSIPLKNFYDDLSTMYSIYDHVYIVICDWLWENPPVTHKDKYLEIRNSIIQSVISREGLKLHAYNSLQIYSYLIAIRLPTAQSTASRFSRHFRLFFINTTSTSIGVEGGGWGVVG